MAGSLTEGVPDYPGGRENNERALLLQAQGRGRQARFARERLRELQQQRQFDASRGQQASEFAQAHAQQERQRQDALAEGARRHDENLGQQRIAQQQLDLYRQTQQSGSEDSRRLARAAGFLNLAQSQDLQQTYGKDAPAIRKALYNKYYEEISGGGQPAPAGGGQPTAPTAPATGGTQAAAPATTVGGLAGGTTDPGAERVKAFQAGQGANVAPTEAPQQGGGMAPSSLVGKELPNASGRLIQTNMGIVPVEKAYDRNTDTAEYVPHTMEGTINNKPAGQLLADKAVLHGRSPESVSGQAAFQRGVEGARNLQIGQETTPPMDISNPEPPRMGGNQPHTAMNFADITKPQAPAQAPAGAAPQAPASTNVGDAGSGQPATPAAGIQRPLVPADYIAHGLSQFFGSQLPNIQQAQQRRQELPTY